MTPASPYHCIVADDEDIDRLWTVSLIHNHPALSLKGTYSSAEEVLTNMGNTTPAVAFFDVDMPGMNGLQLRRRLEQIPAVVFITAYPDYAVESFELDALDFLVKPVKAARFAQTVKRIEEYFLLRNKAALLDFTLGSDTIFIKEGSKQVKIQLHTVIYLEALRDYTRICTTNGAHHVLSSLGNLLKEKSFQSFLRIHKSYAVQKHFINQVTSSAVWAQDVQLPIGRAYKDSIQQFIQ